MAPASLELGITLHKGTEVGSGGFSIVYRATEINTGRAVALKKSRVSLRVNRSLLQHEARVLKLISGHPTVPGVYSYGRMDHFEFLSMELLHRSLGNVVGEEGPLPLAVVLDVADQMLSALQHIQSHGLVHRDIKPDNIMLRSPGSSQICLIDFGLTYRPPKPLPAASRSSTPQGRRSVFGTLPYASLNAHLGQRLTYRDDLESLAYTLLFLLRGNLPWTHYAHHGTPVGRQRQVYAQKSTYDGTRLSAGLGAGFGEFVDYARRLPEDGIPEYVMCGGILKRNAPGRVTAPEENPVVQASPSEPLAPVEVGQIVLTRLLASLTAERYSAQAGHWCSYIHDPCFDTPEWSTPARPSVVVRVEWDDQKNMYSITVVAIAQRRVEVETADIPMVQISSSTSYSDSPQAVVVGEPKWPLESAVCYAFKRPMTFYCLPSQPPVPNTWTIKSADIGTIIKTLTPPCVPYQPERPCGSELTNADTRYDARMRTGYVKLYAELLPMNSAQIFDKSIEWTSERAWFDECVKASRHQDLNYGCWWTGAEFSKTWREPEGWISSSYRGLDYELWDPQQERDKSLTLATSSGHEREGLDDVLDGLGVIVAVEE